MRSASVLLLAVGIVQSSPAPFEIGLWPGEGRPVFEAVATEIALRDQPRRDAKVVERLRVRKGERIEFGETVFRTLKPGELYAVGESHIKGRLLGRIARLSRDDYYSDKFPQIDLVIKAGDRVEYLEYRAEGSCFVLIQEVVIDAEVCPAPDTPSFVMESEPALEWWIDALVNGKRRGWLLVGPSTVKQVRRAF